MLAKANLQMADAYVTALIGKGFRTVLRDYRGMVGYKVYKNAYPTRDTAGEVRMRVASAFGREPDDFWSHGLDFMYVWTLSPTRRVVVGYFKKSGTYIEMIDAGSETNIFESA